MHTMNLTVQDIRDTLDHLEKHGNVLPTSRTNVVDMAADPSAPGAARGVAFDVMLDGRFSTSFASLLQELDELRDENQRLRAELDDLEVRS